MGKWTWCAFIGLLCLGGNVAGASSPVVDAEEWRYYARDAGGTRYSPLDQINTANVVSLERAWTFRTGDIAEGGAQYAECTPLMVDGVVYVITPFSRLVAIDAVSGQELWRFSPEPPLKHTETGGGGLASRGVTYWEAGEKRRVFVPVRDGRIYSVDIETHQADTGFGNAGYIDLRAGLPEEGRFLYLSSPPALYQKVLVPSYGVNDTSARRLAYVPLQAFDAHSGKLLWTFDTVAQPGQFGHDTWAGDSWKGRSGCNPWAPISVDDARGIFYVPVAAPNSDKYGGDREGDNLFSDCLVALNALTGERLWHFQVVHHDIWDYDLAALPNLFDLKVGNETIPAVAAVGKTGFVYVFNRVTGAPIFPIEERPVPASDFPGEHAARTQPFPTKPPAIARQRMTKNDLSDIDPETHAEFEKTFKPLRSEGIFTPPSEEGSIVLPGQHGGGNWSGAAVSPEGMMYVTTTELPYISSISASDGPYGATPSARVFRDEKGYPAIKPPWGTLTKVDLARGELLWQRPLGEYPELTAHGIPPTGQPNFGGATA
ncbi:MAG: PQQ-binding-like beta-propeller repeat protein, partial [Candidatus Hydrogenedentes bacterium]|nr:PQQ-binding-like beta-propeller repeat protein [Candidatus Hydrogenedentota bacterium]